MQHVGSASERRREALNVTSFDARISYDCASLWNTRGDREKIDESQLQRYKLSSFGVAVARARAGYIVRSSRASERTRRRRSPSPFFPPLCRPLTLTGIVEQDEPVLHVLSATSDRDKSLPLLRSSQYLSLSFPLVPSRSSPLSPSVYFKFSHYIRPRAIQDKTFSSAVLSAGSLNDRVFPSIQTTPLLLCLCSDANNAYTHLHTYKCRTP